MAQKAPESAGLMGRETLKEIEVSSVPPIASAVGCLVFPLTFCSSWWVLDPRSSAVVITCGVLTDVVEQPGCHYHNCFGREVRVITTAQISKELPTQKITDSHGNPIMVSAVLTYRITDATKALLNVTRAEEYILAQGSAALKQVVGTYSYDELKMEAQEVQDKLRDVLQPRVAIAGAVVESVNLNELNYAPEIAQAMLRTQAATALVNARHVIVKGAVDIALNAVNSLHAQGMQMSDSEKVRLVSSLLIVTTGDKEPTGTLSL